MEPSLTRHGEELESYRCKIRQYPPIISLLIQLGRAPARATMAGAQSDGDPEHEKGTAQATFIDDNAADHVIAAWTQAPLTPPSWRSNQPCQMVVDG